MPLYKHVLFATDLTEECDQAAMTAYAIANQNQGKLSIVHVLEHTPVIYGSGEFSIPLDINLENHLAANATQALAVISAKYQIPEQDQYLAHGAIKREIIAIAKKADVDLIVIGSHGRSGISAILGSTANAILHLAHCDVLAVRIKATGQ